MFILTHNNYDGGDVKGVFTTVEKAQKYVCKVLNRDLSWSDPSHNINGSIWANTGGGSFSIDPVEVNPKG
jgi:hypothetical protein